MFELLLDDFQGSNFFLKYSGPECQYFLALTYEIIGSKGPRMVFGQGQGKYINGFGPKGNHQFQIQTTTTYQYPNNSFKMTSVKLPIVKSICPNKIRKLDAKLCYKDFKLSARGLKCDCCSQFKARDQFPTYHNGTCWECMEGGDSCHFCMEAAEGRRDTYKFYPMDILQCDSCKQEKICMAHTKHTGSHNVCMNCYFRTEVFMGYMIQKQEVPEAYSTIQYLPSMKDCVPEIANQLTKKYSYEGSIYKVQEVLNSPEEISIRDEDVERIEATIGRILS